MSVAVDANIIDALLLGQGDRQRQLQDFPILGDVWAAIAAAPDQMHDLLITPHHDHSAARVARMLADLTHGAPVGPAARKMSYLTGIVAARLSLEDIWSVLIPMTEWWRGIAEAIGDGWPDGELAGGISDELIVAIGRERMETLTDDQKKALYERDQALGKLRNAVRQLIRLGLLIGALRAAGEVDPGGTAAREARGARSDDVGQTHYRPLAQFVETVGGDRIARLGKDALDECWGNFIDLGEREVRDRMALRGLIWLASSNRRAEFATSRSVPAIKADAARNLFTISCKGISWAVLDSGIDEKHPAFADLTAAGPTPADLTAAAPTPPSRVKATYDFGSIRDILNSGNSFDDEARTSLAARLAQVAHLEQSAIEDTLKQLAKAMGEERGVDWGAVEPLVRRDHPETPAHPHGTHVAGILGGCWQEQASPGGPPSTKQLGVCPDIVFYDFRVLGPDAEQTEFAVIAALQFIGYLNRRNAYPVIDGINMSLSIPHDVRNYACGYTPICLEAEARVAQGTVVVAAAGNAGYQQFRLINGGAFANYAASSITDPGNAEGVITVGSTHRFWPHTYGVSFFSSRGPTGDGRLKPDIVAPGERIESCIPDEGLDAMDGTSMAAPHVSGAAALLMARHQELRGHPARIKQILCHSATDLGRERCFQGAGMVDVLRAIQSV